MNDKWTSLKHNGVLFPPEYQYKKYVVVVKNKNIVLPAAAEELAVAWAQKLETPYVQDKVFQENFWVDFSATLPDDLKNTVFPEDWNFNYISLELQTNKEKLKEKDRETKQKEKEEKEKIKEQYGFAEINGQRTPLANFLIEPPGLFMGRGDHPLRGRWKPRTLPEHVTLNMSKDATPPAAPAGHNWMRVVENKNALWTAMWIERLTGRQKRILFSPVSFVRQSSDIKKFSKAVELANRFDEINAFIESKMKSKDSLTREIATVCHLIARLSIRVGDEKGEDEADTKGATTLLVENVKINGNKITFDFLGKDSIPYHNVVEFGDVMIQNMTEFTSGKKKSDRIFSNISSHDVNEFLGIVLPGLTAKQFRTATGSTLLANELKARNIDKDEVDRKKLLAFTEANLEVAIKLNHQSAVSKNHDASVEALKEKLAAHKTSLKDLEKEYEEAKERNKQSTETLSELLGNTETSKRRTARLAKRSDKKASQKYKEKIAKLKERIKDLTTKIALKEKTRGIALGTSKLNYADPRIIVSWCKDKDFPLDRIYTKTVQEKFKWALESDEDFYKKYPKIN